MTKKFLFGMMSLAALAACTNDDFESTKVAQESSSVQFEIINDAETRASMDGNKIAWSAADGDIFTLYHGAANLGDLSGYQNATYTATATDGAAATLTTPSMILEGGAVMVWPADTTFRIGSNDNLSIVIPEVQTNIENNIPYMSDLISIGAFQENATDYDYSWWHPCYNTAGKDRKYPVFMRPMASQLIIKADYNGTTDVVEPLYGDDAAGGIDPIVVTSIDLQATNNPFTTEIPVKFTAPSTAIQNQWKAAVPYNDVNLIWNQVTDFNVSGIVAAGQTTKLTAKDNCLDGNDGCKLLLLPQATIGSADATSAVVVHTTFGKVIVGAGGKYASDNKAWYKDANTKSTVADGMMSTINDLSAHKASSGVAKDEPTGAAATRYVKVLLNYLDMNGLHVKNDKQLRDVVRVWKHLGHATVNVLLDGDIYGNFYISQRTIELINQVNKGNSKQFGVMPCNDDYCANIVVTGSDYKQEIQDMGFITDNGSWSANVKFANEGDANPWLWKGNVNVKATGVASIINEGTMQNAETATLRTVESYVGYYPYYTQNNVPLVNNGTWNINAGTLNVQFDVTNNGTVNIANGAQYRQDGNNNVVKTFTNEATTLPKRFLPSWQTEKIGVVNNKGVFATVAQGQINNYGLIEHADNNAKTYITANETSGASFGTAFATSPNPAHKMGTINLPYDNKEEDNISISANASKGFVSVTVDASSVKVLNASVVGARVNYINVKGAVETIAAVSSQVKYLEINQPGTEVAWTVTAPTYYEGLILLSDVNIKLNSTIAAGVTYLGADMYVGGYFNKDQSLTAKFNGSTTNVTKLQTIWSGYYGDTSNNVASKYITF